MRIWAIAILLIATLSGCAGNEPVESDTDSEEPAASETPDTNTTEPAGNVTGEAPSHGETPAENETARLSDALALRLGNFTFGESEGNATTAVGEPFNLTVAYTADDINTSALMWQVIFEDAEGHSTSYSGAGLPANVTADLEYEGNITVRAGATDGEDTVRTGRFNVTLEAPEVEASGPAGPVLDVKPIVGLPCPECTAGGPTASVGAYTLATPAPGIIWPTLNGIPLLAPDIVLVPLPPETQGKPYTITSTAGDPDAFFSPTCALIDAGIEFQLGGGHMSGAVGSESGVVPDDAVCLWAWDFDPPLGLGSTIHIVIG